MNERTYLINLYDTYKSLFTEKQKAYFENYYYEDLSLSEIAEIYKVSKTIVGKTLKTIEIIKNETTDKTTKKELENILKG